MMAATGGSFYEGSCLACDGDIEGGLEMGWQRGGLDNIL